LNVHHADELQLGMLLAEDAWMYILVTDVHSEPRAQTTASAAVKTKIAEKAPNLQALRAEANIG